MEVMTSFPKYFLVSANAASTVGVRNKPVKIEKNQIKNVFTFHIT